MAYVTLAEVRDEGITAAVASDAKIEALIDEVCLEIDHHTRWFFEPRDLTITMDGRGTPTLEPPVPPISITTLVHEDEELSVDPEDLFVEGSPVGPGFYAPRIVRLNPSDPASRIRRGIDPRILPVFVEGVANIEATGRWGYTIEDPGGNPEGRTPPAIKRAALLMIVRLLPPVTDPDAAADSAWWRIVEMRTRDQAVRYSETGSAHGAFPGGAGPFTGDPTIDEILLRFQRPHGLGAV